MEYRGLFQMNRYKRIAETVGWAGLVSLLSLLASWGAIALLLGHQFKWAVALASVAFQLDSLDGFVARRLGKASEFGRQLDSMIDAINYSLFAALVTQQILLPNLLGFVAGFFILAFGILRLVLFNIDGYLEDNDVLYYRGVVTCHLSLVTLLIYVAQKMWAPLNSPAGMWVVAFVLMALSVGQLSTLRTRKTGALLFWIPVSIAIGLSAIVWL
jgi:CDP-diacylglycerol--serine O-phosphatidyltransferase